ncbi:Signal transduction histidine kinase [Pedococcus dokdonensis]|uniref:Signal transduction histidine kinase n=1 Tax=Pedococcus dokdonensis TaxID=443156 RepID=A0A1H0PGQ4_9MICO|nr:ATP-binding protein [Pedococcus dokdonensis]SDP04231.1 Signal transduction histidine kinase [Pedococcus dokdonensis]
MSPDTTASTRRAERGIALVSPAMRCVVLVQVVVSVGSGVRSAVHPTAYALLTAAVLAVSVVLIVQCLATGSVRRGIWHAPDLVLAWVALPAMNVLLPEGHVVGTWESWATGYAINVGALAATWLRPWAAIVASLALGAWGFAWLALAHETSWETNLNNALTIPGYAVVVALLAYYLRALAADADQAREDAVAATRALELERYQLTVHDATSILRLLSDEDTPAEVLPGLRLQADREAQRLRHYLTDQPLHAPGDDRRTVGTMLATALHGFDDLPLEPAVELGADVALREDVWTAAARAVATILHNVRMHASARQVVVHADTDGSTWEVVVSDDGIGFDQESEPFGFGLHTQVRQALGELGVEAQIRSVPGRGTSVTIVGPVSA